MRIRDRISTLCGLAAVALAIFALGGAPRWAQAAVAILVAGALAPHVLSRRVFDRVPPLVTPLALAALFTFIQVLPLPSMLVSSVDPVGAALREDGTTLFGIDAWSTLSRDVPGSLRALAFFVVLLGVATVALRMATSEKGRYQVLASVALCCGVAALVTGIHALFGIDDLYGVYTPVNIAPHILGPLLNPNHLGCLMAVGTILAGGLVLYRRQRSWLRVMWIVVVGLCGAVTLATLSRGAALALIGGAFVCAGALVGQRILPAETAKRRKSFVTSSLPIGVVVVCGLVVVLYASAGGVAEQLSRTSFQEIQEPRSKFATWRSTVHLIEESPWVGVGRGGFEPSFTRIHPASAFSTFSHSENEYLQAFVDWGVPAALLLAIAMLWLVFASLRRWREGPLAAAALGALAVVMLQSNFDFGIELLGIAVPITAVVATLTYVPVREASARRITAARSLRGAHLVALAALAIALLLPATTSIAEDHEELRTASLRSPSDLEDVVARHPLDYYPYALASQVMSRTGDRRSIRMLNHALTLHPTHPGLHLSAARMLLATGHAEQSTIEYAAAMHATLDRRELLREIVTKLPTELAARALPLGDGRLEELSRMLADDLQRGDIATAWLARALDLHPDNLRACERLFDLAVGRADVAIAETVGKKCPHYEPSHASRLQLARVLGDKGRHAEAVRLLADVPSWRGRVDDKVGAWLTLCDEHLALGAFDDAKRCLHRLEASGLIMKDRITEISSRLVKIQNAREAAVPLPH